MTETKETIADIVAEMRGYAAGMPDAYHVTMSWHDFRVVLTRIEAAAKRNREDALGNAAALREALEHVEKLAREFAAGNYYIADYPKMLQAAIQTALSAPPRNCDKIRDWREAAKKILELKLGNGYELLEWLFAPVKEGETK